MKDQHTRKITVEVAGELLDRATANGEGVSEVVRRGLELVASQQAWRRLEQWSGKVSWSVNLVELRED